MIAWQWIFPLLCHEHWQYKLSPKANSHGITTMCRFLPFGFPAVNSRLLHEQLRIPVYRVWGISSHCSSVKLLGYDTRPFPSIPLFYDMPAFLRLRVPTSVLHGLFFLNREISNNNPLVVVGFMLDNPRCLDGKSFEPNLKFFVLPLNLDDLETLCFRMLVRKMQPTSAS